ncbi:hypothetical protein [Variovorax sp. OK605]|uniref:hypothetical protein n=1 Tax=Variovorax sp. OK605 TaxID=1855317 RepID=UPI0011601AE8|nr:hypothetical protein [Variovorax sp. OK605]
MYNIEGELDAVLGFQTQVGSRRHGHYDHDAHGMTGPMGRVQVRRKKADNTAPVQSSSGCSVIVHLTRHPDTGEVIRA